MYHFLLYNLILVAAAPVIMTLDETYTGQTIQIRVGEEVAVMLKGNPTTGYVWDVAAIDETVLKQIGEPQFRPDSENRGGGGEFILRFEALNKGKTSLRMVYHRPFEKSKPPLKSFKLDVMVR